MAPCIGSSCHARVGACIAFGDGLQGRTTTAGAGEVPWPPCAVQWCGWADSKRRLRTIASIQHSQPPSVMAMPNADAGCAARSQAAQHPAVRGKKAAPRPTCRWQQLLPAAHEAAAAHAAARPAAAQLCDRRLNAALVRRVTATAAESVRKCAAQQRCVETNTVAGIARIMHKQAQHCQCAHLDIGVRHHQQRALVAALQQHLLAHARVQLQQAARAHAHACVSRSLARSPAPSSPLPACREHCCRPARRRTLLSASSTWPQSSRRPPSSSPWWNTKSRNSCSRYLIGQPDTQQHARAAWAAAPRCSHRATRACA